ncbi:MAG: sensor histidine kinase [Nitrospirales bacterium]
MIVTNTGLECELEVVRVLLIEDDEDDAFIARSLLSDIRGFTFEVDWISSYEEAFTAIVQNHHHICFLDYCLGSRTGLNMLGDALQYGCRIPIIMMTGSTDRDVDLKAVQLGAADYVIKGAVESSLLERVIRHARERKKAEVERQELHAKLLETSRQLGMADIATSVLHNVGNVLNSINVSAGLVSNVLRNAHVSEIGRINELLQTHSEDLSAFLTDDPKGKLVPQFLGELGKDLSARVRQSLQEMDALHSKVDHVRRIIDAQQNVTTPGGLQEPVRLEDLVDQALMINRGDLDQYNIEVIQEYAVLPQVILDKHQVLQILVNLIRNAKHAMMDKEGRGHCLTLRIQRCLDREGFLQIQVGDTGVGITSENLTKIFAQGFTTKAKGRGIGLHCSALAAKNCGGSLQVSSNGKGCGSTFTLTLPERVMEIPE